MAASDQDVRDAMLLQAAGCEALGSRLYADLLRALVARLPFDSPLWKRMRDASPRPVHDAIPLRLLGAVHRLVLAGSAPNVARHYPSAGGSPTANLHDDFLDALEIHVERIEASLHEQVQTNEVARSAALVSGFALIARRAARPLNLLELGSSSGLNLRWDRYRFESARTGTGFGDRSSPLVFDDLWDTPVDLSGPLAIGQRRGCDISPLDAADPETSLRLRSFVWPDQEVRYHRLATALHLARDLPVQIDQVDAGSWLPARLMEAPAGMATVVFHSIVWQYMPPSSQQLVRQALAEYGRTRPVHWLRMEPAGKVADIRLTTWPSGTEEILGTAGYHGTGIKWLAEPQIVAANR